MPSRGIHVGLDSQCLSYLIEAMSVTAAPVGDLAPQKLALFRCYLYRPGGLHVTPTVTAEWHRIRDADRLALHGSYSQTLIGETQPINQRQIDARTIALDVFHSDADDCRILAEAEDASLSVLLTFDTRFIDRLQPHTTVTLTRPTDFWASLSVPRGARPATEPRADNPLSLVSW